jgi:hypothetical protein
MYPSVLRQRLVPPAHDTLRIELERSHIIRYRLGDIPLEVVNDAARGVSLGISRLQGNELVAVGQCPIVVALQGVCHAPLVVRHPQPLVAPDRLALIRERSRAVSPVCMNHAAY